MIIKLNFSNGLHISHNPTSSSLTLARAVKPVLDELAMEAKANGGTVELEVLVTVRSGNASGQLLNEKPHPKPILDQLASAPIISPDLSPEDDEEDAPEYTPPT